MTRTLQLTFEKPEWAQEFLTDLDENKPCNEHGDYWQELYGPIDAGFVPDKPETPEEAMKREMLNAIRGVVGECNYGSAWFCVVQYSLAPAKAFYQINTAGEFSEGSTLAEAIRNIPTPDKIKAARIAELEAELAKLKSDTISHT